jgi:hypothetical protein
MWLSAQFVPIGFFNLNAIVFRRLLDVSESLVAVGIRDTQDLVKASQSVLDMRGVRQRLLPLLWERIYAIGEVTALRKLTVFRVRIPSRSVCHRCGVPLSFRLLGS